MKKFTLFAIAALISVVAFAQKPNPFLKSNPIPFEQTQLKAKAVSRQATVRKAPRRSLGLVTPPESAVAETYYTASGKLLVYGSNGFVDGGRESIQVIVDGTDIYIAGLAYWAEDAWIKGTIDGATATFPASQQVDDDESNPEWISGSDDGETICDVVFNFDQEAGVLECTNTYIGECAVEDAFSIYAYWTQPTFTKEQPEGPQVVEAPDGLETEEYAVSARNYKDDADVSGVWQIGFDGNDVYVQGMCSYIPEAWAKGTLEGTTITFASGQYFGSYSNSYDMFLNTLLVTDVVFDYDADAGMLTAQNEVFLTDNDEYYFDSYRNAVIKKVVEQAAMPANPAITSLTNGQYGWYFNFNVPNVDVDGNGLLSSKLSYIIYTDTEGTIAPLTFTPATHSRLTEDMTEIPYGFTENYDFYDTQIYLNDLYSADWTRIGIQSIYRGGGEENATEIQWFDIEKEDTNSTAIEWVAADQGYENAEEVTIIQFSETVTGTLAKADGSSTPKYYDSGTALRMYAGNTLTITSEEPMTKIVITMADNATTSQTWLKADQEEYTYSSEDKVGTWTGEATQVVFTVPTKEEAGLSTGNPQARIAKIAIYFGEEEPAGPVVLPDGVEAEEYTMFYEDSNQNSAAKTVNVAVDGNDVYFQGFSDYIPEAWVKGTKDGNTVTFPPMQLFGEYSGYESYAFYGDDDVVFTYDAEADTYTAEGEIYGVLGDQYYDGRYFNPIIKKVADKAAMPANPEITAMENGSYGWYIDFNVPAVDVNGEDLAIGKLSYMIYSDTQGEVAPLTFTPATHSKLTEDMTEIPYGFTESYDFYSDEIYLNDLYSEDWTRIGIQSIYRGGGEENKTEIQWFDILPEPEAIEAPEGLETETYIFTAIDVYNDANAARKIESEEDVTFNFNAMDVPVSSGTGDNYDPAGDISETLTLTEGVVTLAISPKVEGFTTPNRFWQANNVPQLRVYSGTLTFAVPEGASMTEIVFNHNGKWGDNTVEEKVIPNDTEAKAATWTGEAQNVVVTIAGNSQIDNIVVTVKSDSEEPVEVYTYQMQVGFDGNDVYFKGVSDDTADMWLKGTLSDDGKSVTIPANQYMGQIDLYGIVTFDYFFSALGEDNETLEDIVLNYDAETSTFTTDQTLVLHDGKRSLGKPYQVFTNVVITKMPEFAATPADPSIEGYKFEGTSFPYIEFVIPAQDVDGNDILTAKLFYTVWIEEDGVEKPFVLLADQYRDVTEDMTEVPYDWDDSYDIYKGGSRVYINPTDAFNSWTKFGIQSIYYGGNERNTSNIVWMENPVYTGITDVNFNNQKVVVFDLQGRRVAAPAKGLYIVNGKKVVLK